MLIDKSGRFGLAGTGNLEIQITGSWVGKWAGAGTIEIQAVGKASLGLSRQV